MSAKSGLLVLFVVAFGCYVTVADANARAKRDDPWRITTIVDWPYTTKKDQNPKSNDDYEGYIPDLLKAIGKHLDQKYTIYEVPDKKYGAKDGDRWSGMIGEVFYGKAQIAAAAITVSEARREAVNFTRPLMEIQSVIVVKKPTDGSESKIKSVKDLADQKDLKYGAVKDGTTLQLIRASSDPQFQKINKELTSHPDQLVSTSEEGIRRVREGDGKYAFITESATGDYWTKRNPCDLMFLETSLPKKEYAFAVSKQSSAIMARLDGAIGDLKESGELAKVKSKWWKEECSAAVRFHLAPVALVQLAVVGVVMMMMIGSN